MNDEQTDRGQTEPGVALELGGAVAVIAFDRPKGLNAFDQATRLAFLEQLRAVQHDNEIRAVVICGNERNFNVGADLNEFLHDKVSGAEIKQQLETEYFPAYDAIGQMPKPVIAAVRGAAAGIGMSLALQCDLVVMGESAYLMSPFANLSLCPDGGASWLLPARMGYKRAFEAAIECRKVQAQECLELGLANRVVPDEDVVEEALGWATDLAKRAPLAIATTKKAMRSSSGMTYQETFALEADMQAANVDSDDFREGVEAFLNKRPPQFQGR
jgi:2-(1,2-epoxy-1,2-dihydrophenyl)acetyl-CoA isomerase